MDPHADPADLAYLDNFEHRTIRAVVNVEARTSRPPSRMETSLTVRNNNQRLSPHRNNNDTTTTTITGRSISPRLRGRGSIAVPGGERAVSPSGMDTRNRNLFPKFRDQPPEPAIETSNREYHLQQQKQHKQLNQHHSYHHHHHHHHHHGQEKPASGQYLEPPCPMSPGSNSSASSFSSCCSSASSPSSASSALSPSPNLQHYPRNRNDLILMKAAPSMWAPGRLSPVRPSPASRPLTPVEDQVKQRTPSSSSSSSSCSSSSSSPCSRPTPRPALIYPSIPNKQEERTGAVVTLSLVSWRSEEVTIPNKEQKGVLSRALAAIPHFEEGHLLDTIEKGVYFPVVHVSGSLPVVRNKINYADLLPQNALGPEHILHQGIYEEVVSWVPDLLVPCPSDPADWERCFIVIGFKTLDSSFNQVLEETWRDWTGARYIYFNLSDDLGLKRLTFYRRLAPRQIDLFMYFVLAELETVTDDNRLKLLDFVYRMRVERMNGYISVYRERSLDKDSNYHSASSLSLDSSRTSIQSFVQQQEDGTKVSI